MNRAFTISFDFEGRTYLAFASMNTKGSDVVYSVRLYDEKLHRIVPTGSISYNSQRPLCPHSLTHPMATRLFTCINEAVDGHSRMYKSR
ncbi:MAG TPA: hypothetical protein VFR58_17275 [Flavisolibacter sp.]|nr:hypothetical protein [Flavisolibacter sp.]